MLNKKDRKVILNKPLKYYDLYVDKRKGYSTNPNNIARWDKAFNRENWGKYSTNMKKLGIKRDNLSDNNLYYRIRNQGKRNNPNTRQFLIRELGDKMEFNKPRREIKKDIYSLAPKTKAMHNIVNRAKIGIFPTKFDFNIHTTNVRRNENKLLSDYYKTIEPYSHGVDYQFNLKSGSWGDQKGKLIRINNKIPFLTKLAVLGHETQHYKDVVKNSNRMSADNYSQNILHSMIKETSDPFDSLFEPKIDSLLHFHIYQNSYGEKKARQNAAKTIRRFLNDYQNYKKMSPRLRTILLRSK